MGMIDGGNLTGTNAINYSLYTSKVVMIVTADNTGTSMNNNSLINSFVRITNVIGNGQAEIRISGANKQNLLTITGQGQGVLNDPIIFTGFNSFVSVLPNTKVVFSTNAFLNRSQNTATINGYEMEFSNISNYDGIVTATLSSEEQAAVNSSVSATTTTNNNDEDSSSGSSSSEVTMQATMQNSASVGQNTNNISTNQAQQDTQIMQSQPISTNCT